MKNKTIFYLLTILITFLSFNLNVNAAQELTCIYEGEDNIAVVQYSNGNKKIYKNDDSASIDSYYWKKLDNLTVDTTKTQQKDSSNNLTKCPPYIAKLEKNDTSIKFIDILSHDDDRVEQAHSKLNQKSSSTTIIEFKNELPRPTNSVGWINELKSPYTAQCVYERLISYTENWETKTFTHKIQISYGKNTINIAELDPKKGDYSNVEYYRFNIDYDTDKVYSFKIDSNFTISNFLTQYKGQCPRFLSVDRDSNPRAEGEPPITVEQISTTIYMPGTKGQAYSLSEVKGVNPENDEQLSLTGILSPNIVLKDKINDCSELLGEDIAGWLNVIWNLVKIGIPIVLIGIGILDFVQSVFSGKEDSMKKSQGKFIKRIIIAVVIFLIPTILELLLNIANSVWDNIGTDICGIIF